MTSQVDHIRDATKRLTAMVDHLISDAMADAFDITIRREPAGVRLVAWGNASAAQRQLWNALAWAFAVAGGTPPVAGEEMPPGWKP